MRGFGIALAGLALLMVAATSGCFARGASANGALRTRAAHEFQCIETAITMEDIDSRTRIVRGCGREAYYVSDCQNNRCTWVRNSEITGRPFD